METFFIRLLQLILSLSLLVLIHEGGHFLFARLFKIKVEKFYMFFDVGFALFRYKPKHSDTEYGIGWLPFGGYCKIAGMVDESMDMEQMKKPAQPWEFRSKPAWQRLLVMVGGVLMNFLAALLIYSLVLYHWGDSFVALRDMTYGMQFNETAQDIGFRNGDILLNADGKPLGCLDADMLRAIAEARVVTVERQGQEVEIYMPEISLLDMVKSEVPFVTVLVPNVVDSVFSGRAFEKVGIQRGDTLLAVDERPIASFSDFTEAMVQLREKAKAAGQKTASFMLTYSRAGVVNTLPIETDTLFKVGVSAPALNYKVTRRQYTFWQSFPAGARFGVNVLKGYVSDLKYIFTKEGAKSVGGFGTIGSIFPKVWNWHRFWMMTALISIILAFMNILPIPILDGGYVLLLIIESLTGWKPKDKALEVALTIGLVLLILLMLWANLNDVIRFLF